MKYRLHPDASGRRRGHGGSDRWSAAAALVASGALLLALAGCSSTRVDAPAPVEDRLASGSAGSRGAADAASSAGAGDRSAGVSETQVASVDLGALGGGAGSKGMDAMPAAQRVIYFDFDSFVVKDEFRSVIDLGARYLSADRQRRVLIEGHTDERGGREYNLALGQKRADSVVRALQLLGAQDGQMEAVSYGEERPAVPGGGEAAWAKNRRAELKDR